VPSPVGAARSESRRRTLQRQTRLPRMPARAAPRPVRDRQIARHPLQYLFPAPPYSPAAIALLARKLAQKRKRSSQRGRRVSRARSREHKISWMSGSGSLTHGEIITVAARFPSSTENRQEMAETSTEFKCSAKFPGKGVGNLTACVSAACSAVRLLARTPARSDSGSSSVWRKYRAAPGDRGASRRARYR